MNQPTATCSNCNSFSIDDTKLPQNYHTTNEPINAEGICNAGDEPTPTHMLEVCIEHSHKGIGTAVVQLQIATPR